jgi:hypothetical protein
MLQLIKRIYVNLAHSHSKIVAQPMSNATGPFPTFAIPAQPKLFISYMLLGMMTLLGACQSPGGGADCAKLSGELKTAQLQIDSLKHAIELTHVEDIFHEAIELEEFGLLHEAEKKFNHIIKDYPKSRFKKKAEAKLQELLQMIAKAEKNLPKEPNSPASPNASNNAPSTGNEQFTSFESKAFYEMFVKDKETATRLYKNKHVVVEGTINSIHNYSNDHTTNVEVELNDLSGNGTFVICNINRKQDKEIVMNKKPGDKVKIRGRYEFRFLEIPHIEECSILD